ncbi:hypothetical protein K2173_009139 [Erythroxylum novogranatense]|uniref:Uncharacterized protein n=1 Tax=Erythroxylum novogranatense TaxID=1862640 RepID=A0AAV8TLN0_9ROSI|nr:hypothetical protein K2173_009139 [Erythroxylum novogranatense]
MSGSGGVPMPKNRGDNRFYVSPAMRKQQQQQQQEKKQHKPAVAKNSGSEMGKRSDSDQCGSHSSLSSNCSVSGRTVGEDNLTNLDRFLEHTTPVVPAQLLPKTSVRGWRTHEPEYHPYFMLHDLWESFREWSAYGAGVPLLLDENETVMQYYCPSLSGIQLYVDPSRPSPWLRRHGEESDNDSSRETSSDGSSESGKETNNFVRESWGQQNNAGVKFQSLSGVSLRSKHLKGSSSDEYEISNPLDRLVFEYMEYDPPFVREPLTDKISFLTLQFPELRTYRSCDLSPSSWISVAWYPIYRIPMGTTLQNLDACFLTFHSLSAPSQSQNIDGMRGRGSSARDVHSDIKLPLPTFGLASYKFKVPFWNSNGVYECQKAGLLLRQADNWLKLLQVNLPDYGYFITHNSSRR